jgi:hypothetical protein
MNRLFGDVVYFVGKRCARTELLLGIAYYFCYQLEPAGWSAG